jgi:hypothetical protein
MADTKDAIRDIEELMRRIAELDGAVAEASNTDAPAQHVADSLGIDMENMLTDPDFMSATPEEAEELFKKKEAQDAKKLADGMSDFLTR